MLKKSDDSNERLSLSNVARPKNKVKLKPAKSELKINQIPDRQPTQMPGKKTRSINPTAQPEKLSRCN